MNIKIPIKVFANRLLERPIYAQLHVTRRCNYRCSFCSAWKTGNLKSEMTIEDYKLVSDYLYDLGVRLITIGGGEPLIRKDIVEIARCFPPSRFIVRIQTNGALLLENNLLDRLDEAGIKRYTVSLDSLNSDEMDSVRGKEHAWEKAVKALTELGRRYPAGCIVSSTAVTSKNIEQLPEIIKFGQKLGVSPAFAPVNIEPDRNADDIHLAGDDISMDPRNIDLQVIEAVFAEIKKIKRSGSLLANSNFYIDESLKYLRTGEKWWKCHAGTLYFLVMPDGDVAPCNELPAVFNLLEKNPCKYMKSRSYLEKVKKMRKQCGGCIHDCWKEPSCLMHPSVLFQRGLEFIKGQI
jgi:MoaA/NifB/PqqE/SkfB family radical SAM enzyme